MSANNVDKATVIQILEAIATDLRAEIKRASEAAGGGGGVEGLEQGDEARQGPLAATPRTTMSINIMQTMMRLHTMKLRQFNVSKGDFDAACAALADDADVQDRSKKVEELVELPMAYLHRTYKS